MSNINLWPKALKSKSSVKERVISQSSQLAMQVERDTAKILYAHSFTSLFGSFMAAAILTFAFDTPDVFKTKILWFACMCLLLTLRLADTLYYQFNLKGEEFDGSAAKTRFLIGATATALMWSSYGIYIFDKLDELEVTTTLLFLCVTAGGAPTVLSGHKTMASLFITIIMAPISVRLLFSDFEYGQGLGVLGLLMNGILVSAALKASKFTMQTVELKNSNAQLLEKVQAEKSEIDSVNEKLNSAYTQLNSAHNSLEAEVEKRTHEITQLSNLDPLTGLYNRKAFTALLKDKMCSSNEHGNSLALLFIDLNGFKKINDTLGHKIGDLVLMEVAQRLQAFANDNHAGRWGGDEFLLALTYADQETAMSVATALQSRIAQPFDIQSNQFNLSASVGIAMYPEHSLDSLELIQLADFAMFEQKKNGRRAPLLFTHNLYQSLKHVQRLRDGLQQAISKKQLSVHYQPIMCCQENRPWSFEALLRWDFNGQPIRPDIFIPLAEQTGVIKDLGAWVLHRACIDAQELCENNQASVSVNVSLMQLLDADFIATLDKALYSSGLDPRRLHLEITESMFADNKARILEQLAAIKSRQVQVSIDDFGTGYSSLSQLQNLDFDTVKIDKTFVHNFEQGGEAIIRATLFIAREFGCQSVAEGIETREQAEALKALGVNFLQGYLFAKPMPKDLLIHWLADARMTGQYAVK